MNTIILDKFNEFDISEDVVIRFSENISISDIISTIEYTNKQENDYYNNNKKLIEYKYILNNISMDKKIELFKYIFSKEDIINKSLLSQVLICIRNYNTLNDDFFANEDVIFNTLEEFLDFKIGLSREIKEFNTKFSKIVFSMMKSIFKVESNFLDNVVEIGNTFKVLLYSLDFITISAIINNSNDFNTDELFILKDAYNYISSLSEKQNISVELLKGLRI